MRPQLRIVKLLVSKHVDTLELSRLLVGVGVHIDLLDDLNLLDLAMDIIGYPQDNVQEFDVDILLNDISTAPHKRNDFDNMFDRGLYKEGEWDLSKNDIDSFVEKLYDDYDGLLLTRPHLFVKK